jgi:hypothetical protein
MSEIIHLKNAALPAFLKEASYNRFAEPAYFKRFLNFAVQYGGLEPRDIADLNGVAVSTVLRWMEGSPPLPRVFMRQAVCREVKGVLDEINAGREVKVVIEERLGE